jgi:hypothetical protein
MPDGLQVLLSVLRQAWGALTIIMVVMASLGALAHVLRTLWAATLGARFWIWQSLTSIATIFILVLIAFLGIPPVVRAVAAAVPGSAGCGPIAELGMFASGLIAAIVSVRMLLSFVRVLAASAVGGSLEISQALIEAIEAISGMLLASIVVPLAAAFLGVCH